VDARKSVIYCLLLLTFALDIKLNCVANCVVMSLMVVAKLLLREQQVCVCILSNRKAIMHCLGEDFLGAWPLAPPLNPPIDSEKAHYSSAC